jgi:aminotransferase in exopolysaccharide biosynthesis
VTELGEELVKRLRAVIGDGPHALHAPDLGPIDEEAVAGCVRSGFVSSVGPEVDRFERELERITGSGRAIAVVNGTAALHAALLVAGVRPGDEVVVPALSFVATANAVTYCGATPHFADIEPHTLGLDPDALRARLRDVARPHVTGIVNCSTGRPIRALVPMHTFGHPCDTEALAEVAAEFGLVMVEDAAESLGSRRHGRHTGTSGLLGVLSFNGNKVITTGGGGAILTDDLELAARVKHLTTTAKVPHRWKYVHDVVGFNYRMPNLNAALGCAQLSRLHEFVASKRRLAERYAATLAGMAGVTLLGERPGSSSNYWLQAIILDDHTAPQRDQLLDELNAAGFGSRPVWEPLHTLAPHCDAPRAPLHVTEDMAARIINLPSSAGLA